MLHHEGSDNIDNFPTGLNMKLYNQGFPFFYNIFYQGGGQNVARGGGLPGPSPGYASEFNNKTDMAIAKFA
jgi:hypothetical protein